MTVKRSDPPPLRSEENPAAPPRVILKGRADLPSDVIWLEENIHAMPPRIKFVWRGHEYVYHQILRTITNPDTGKQHRIRHWRIFHDAEYQGDVAL